jgi:hypothetical protein
MGVPSLQELVTLLLLPIGAAIKLVAIAFLGKLAIIAAEKFAEKVTEDNKDPP